MDKNKETEKELQTSFIMTCAGAVKKVLIEASKTLIKSGLDSASLLTMLVIIGDDIIFGLEEAWQCSHDEALKRYEKLLREYREQVNSDKNKN